MPCLQNGSGRGHAFCVTAFLTLTAGNGARHVVDGGQEGGMIICPASGARPNQALAIWSPRPYHDVCLVAWLPICGMVALELQFFGLH